MKYHENSVLLWNVVTIQMDCISEDSPSGTINVRPEAEPIIQKYGDDDLASKKRKSVDKYDDLFHQSSSFLNSTLKSPEEESSECLYLEAFSKQTNENNAFVSKTPSASSCHFQNTFDVLENQMSNKRCLSPRQLEQFMTANPYFKDRFLNSISEESKEESEETPSFFELELEASSRLRDLINNKSAKDDNISSNVSTITSPLNELLHDFVPKCDPETVKYHPNPEVFLKDDKTLEEIGEYPEYLYHVSKGKDGRLYLRVVRSLLVDKGNNKIIIIIN